MTLENITELHGMQQQVMFASRMAGIGRMAAGLAHELRNPLGNMTGAAQELDNCKDQELAAERTQLTRLFAKRVSASTSSLKNF